MQPRIKRYKKFIESQYIGSLVKNTEYSFGPFNRELLKKLRAKEFKRIIFTGMGCSAIVSDVIKGFFIENNIPVDVEIFNDYDLDYLAGKSNLADKGTLVIISSYSGYSIEPICAYKKIKKVNKNIIFLTSGGELARIGLKEGVSIIYWNLQEPDREYPLFHVPQYLSIFCNVFCELGFLDTNYEKELKQAMLSIKKHFNLQVIRKAEAIASRLRNKEIVLLANPKWYYTFLKLALMHFNEIAMAPAHRNFLHEFTHSEIAAYSKLLNNQAIIFFRDKTEDAYSLKKIQNLMNLLKNQNTEIISIDFNQNGFFKQFFFNLQFIQYVVYFLAVYYDISSKELISQAAGNLWYNQKTIQKEIQTQKR